MNIIFQLKKAGKIGSLVLGISGVLMSSALASSAFQADSLYQQEHYEKALAAYLNAAEYGSPHVYYQLGTIYYKGLGTKPSYLSALLWFSLAAEHQFSDAEKIYNLLTKNIDEQEKENLKILINNFKQKYGKQKIQEKYLPKIIETNLSKKVTFGGVGKDSTELSEADKLFGIESVSSLSEIDIDDDFDISFDNSMVDSFDDFEDFNSTNEDFSDSADTGTDDPTSGIQDSYIQQKNPLDLPFLVTVDYEVAPDGTIRNINKQYSKGRPGNVRTAIFDYSRYTFPKPTFDGKRIDFLHRQHIGVSKLGTGEVRERHPELYSWVRRENNKLKQDTSTQATYKRAMLLTYYPWFPRDEGYVESLLKDLSEKGHVMAQYEYGQHLYREQIDIPEAIKWLSLASQFGLSKAQYALARIFQVSPWVVKDEKKALLWYENAAKSAHPNAQLRIAELKILASDESLRDQTTAIAILKNIEEKQSSNPEYNYLVAIAHLSGEYRDFPKVLTYLRKAISRGTTLDWDVSVWQNQLDSWTTGRVLIYDDLD